MGCGLLEPPCTANGRMMVLPSGTLLSHLVTYPMSQQFPSWVYISVKSPCRARRQPVCVVVCGGVELEVSWLSFQEGGSPKWSTLQQERETDQMHIWWWDGCENTVIREKIQERSHLHKLKCMCPKQKFTFGKNTYTVKIDVRLVALRGERREIQGEMFTYRVTCPLQTHKSESLRVGTRSLWESYVWPGLAPMVYGTLTPQDNIKTNIKAEVEYSLQINSCQVKLWNKLE